MNKEARTIKALGEIVLRIKNMQSMREFYEKVLGLKSWGISRT